MSGIRSTAVVAAVCGVLATSAVYAADSPFLGRWQWNRAQSTLPPGEPAPKDVVSNISRAEGKAVSWEVTIVTPDDQTHVVKFEADPAGEVTRLSSDTTATASVDATTLQATFSGPGGQSDTQTCSVAANGKQMTCKGVLKDGQGRSTSYVDVYDRM